MRRIAAIGAVLIAATLLQAATPERILSLYQQGDYRSACLEGAPILRDNRTDETLINAFGIACLRSDFIDLSSNAILHLRSEPGSRQNAAYILTVVLQKKLLYHAMADDVDIKGTLLPRTPHILSKVYSAYVQEKYEQQGARYVMRIDGERVELDSLHEGGHFKIRIRRYEGDRLIDQHLYW